LNFAVACPRALYPACGQELASARPLVALIFEPILATAGGKEPNLSVRRSLIAAPASLGDMGEGGMVLGVRRRHR